jgi:PAS domain S-box-containing protein
MVSEDNGKVVELNRAWQEATGYSMAEIPTLESWSQLALSEQYGTLIESSIVKLRESNESKFPLRVFTRIKNGTVRSWLLYAALLGNPQTDKTAILLSAVDLTERENAEAERDRLFLLEQKARALAEASNRSKDQFIATLSHELRTPLNAAATSCLVGGSRYISIDQFAWPCPEHFRHFIQYVGRLMHETAAAALATCRRSAGRPCWIDRTSPVL